MALQFISNESGFINYMALSTDIASSKIPGAVLIGRLVFLTDTGVTKIILPNLELADYALPASFSGSIALGTVDISQVTPGTTNGVATGVSSAGVDGLGNFIAVLKAPGSVNSAPLATFPYGFNGTSWDKVRVANISKDISAVTVTTITTLWTPGVGKKFRLMGGTLSCSTAVSILFEDNTAGAIIFRTPKLLVDTPYTFEVNGGQGFLSAVANNVLKATSSAAGVITGTLFGTEE
jgi:hypothetical protein